MLAGGRGSRAGGADKPALVVGGRSLAAAVVAAAVSAGAGRVVVVGPERPGLLAEVPAPPRGLVFVRETPPGSGPAPALRRGLAEVTAPVVAVLAADLPFLRGRHLRSLLAAVSPGAAPDGLSDEAAGPAGAVMVDASGREQWLLGCWQTAAVRQAAGAAPGGALSRLLGPLNPARLGYDQGPGEPPPWLDCDTVDDVRRARAWRPRTDQRRREGKAEQ